MPILTTWNDPTSVDPISGAFALITELHFDLARKNINIGYSVYRSANEYSRGREPLNRSFMDFTDREIRPIYGPAPLLEAGVDAVYSGVFDENGIQIDNILISPAIAPVYGPEPITSPGKPNFIQILSSNSKLYGSLAHSAYTLMSGQFHIFKDAVFLPPSGFIL